MYTGNLKKNSVANPGCLFRIFSSRIPDRKDPGSQIRICIKILSTVLLTKTNFSLSSRKYDPGCSPRILEPDFFPSWIPYPGSRSKKSIGSQIRIRNTANGSPLWHSTERFLRRFVTIFRQTKRQRLLIYLCLKFSSVSTDSLGPDPDPFQAEYRAESGSGFFWWPKIGKNLQLKFFIYFIYLL